MMCASTSSHRSNHKSSSPTTTSNSHCLRWIRQEEESNSIINIPTNTTRKVQSGSRSFSVHNFGNLALPPSTLDQPPPQPLSHIEIESKYDPSLENDLSVDIDIDLPSSQSGSHHEEEQVDTFDPMDYRKVISGTLPTEKKSHVQCTNLYPIFSSLSDRLSRYGIELDEDVEYKCELHRSAPPQNSSFAGQTNPAFTNSTDSLRKLQGVKPSLPPVKESHHQLTTDSAISLSRQTSTESGSSSSNSSSSSSYGSNSCKKYVEDDAKDGCPKKPRPKLPPLSVCEEMNRKGFKRWSRGQRNMDIVNSAPISSELNSPPVFIKPKSGSIIPGSMATKAMADKDRWVKNHEGQWIKNEVLDNVRNLSYKKRESVTFNLPPKGRRSSVMRTIFGQGGGRRFSQDLRHLAFPDEDDEDMDIDSRTGSPVSGHRSPTPIKDFIGESETAKVIFFQVFIPFLVAGFGNVGAGLILDKVQHWPVFKSTTELFLLVASFLGFKGNLEMTLAARLATQANTGQLDEPSVQFKVAIGNISLIQSQAIVVGFLAALIAIAVNYCKEFTFHLDSALLIIATALVTASITGLFLTILMVLVTIFARKVGVNPDNVSTLLAAFLGDISAVILLSGSAKLFYDYKYLPYLAPVVIAIFAPLLIIFLILARRNQYTHDVVGVGWFPIIIAMVISSIGGLIFDFSVSMFETIAVFQPIINGVGSNLVAVQASRISTYFHQRCNLGSLPVGDGIKYGTLSSTNPLKAFFGKNANVKTARLLLLMCLPGHIIYIVTIRLIAGNDGNVYITLPFIGIYLLVAVLQVMILLYMAHLIVPFLWSKSIDPDNAAIPGIMACGDLLGTAFLTIAYFVLTSIGDPNVVANGLKHGHDKLVDVLNTTISTAI